MVTADQFELTHKGNKKSPPGKRKFEPPKNPNAPKWHGGHSHRVDKVCVASELSDCFPEAEEHPDELPCVRRT